MGSGAIFHEQPSKAQDLNKEGIPTLQYLRFATLIFFPVSGWVWRWTWMTVEGGDFGLDFRLCGSSLLFQLSSNLPWIALVEESLEVCRDYRASLVLAN